MQYPLTYEGVDFASRDRNIGRCRLVDDGETLQLQLDFAEEEQVKLTAVDCPLGTSLGFQKLLAGNTVQDVGEDGYKTRATERWLRGLVPQYETNARWLNRNDAERQAYPRPSYFNGGSHVKPTLGLQIVPACIAWILEKFGPGVHTEDRLQFLSDARRGTSRIVEAHPRPFLYSMIERLHLNNDELITVEVLDTVASYKDPPGESHAEQRAAIYRLLHQNTEWMGHPRAIAPNEPPNDLIESDHTFDAWLCCLTAWAHDHGETISWQAAGINPEFVGVEGHILVLGQAATTNIGQRPTP